jgi:hypothetical protein
LAARLTHKKPKTHYFQWFFATSAAGIGLKLNGSFVGKQKQLTERKIMKLIQYERPGLVWPLWPAGKLAG